ncbi:Cytochrome p450 [Thalictrum thalictroides]|uniref:Cytochrome p450 n=1 Tax=Thalictrum thalictroides TaxID=46969 RepID=A0A7J6UV70_THATH|nr:Cytochrome p450 [Thalictrum thalictroides]
MELQQLTTFLFILNFIFFLLLLVKISKKSRNTHSSSPLPPGPFKLPIIGHLHHLLGLPHHKLKDLAKKYGPIMYLKLGEVPTVVISSPGAAEQIMKKHDLKFVDRPDNAVINVVTYGYKDVVGAPYGDSWRRLRKICVLELLSAKKVQSFWSLREEEVSKLVEKISLVAGSQINLSKMIFALMNDITARAAFGKTCKDKEAFISVADYILRMVAGFSFVDIFPSMKFFATISGTNSKIKMVHQTVNKILDEIIREHKENRMETLKGEVEEDLMDVLLRIQEAPELEIPITMENIKAVIFDMFIAGTDTTSTLVEWTMIELLRNPSVMEKTQEEVRQVFNGKKKIDQADMDKLNYLSLQPFLF